MVKYTKKRTVRRQPDFIKKPGVGKYNPSRKGIDKNPTAHTFRKEKPKKPKMEDIDLRHNLEINLNQV